ncbi:tyrosine-type recombinase/integrase [Terriglobus albidus]|uniref:tyrosine-type recombinase/integrase n=1 Tax=Terriglobus albidus TaxID=1592106 RepID=UPI0021E0E54D|nr:tyrosine-type recombinase/integrase [Terriglobus albidus]
MRSEIGWHTFRHTFGTLLKANGEDVKTVQELLRHANSRITLEVYTQAVTSNKRATEQGCKDDDSRRGSERGRDGPAESSGWSVMDPDLLVTWDAIRS